jgi:hypothetical protein
MRYFLKRPRAFWISACNLLGLACSMAGVLLLFLYAVSPEVPGTIYLGPDRTQEEVQRQAAETRRYGRNAIIGLILVGVGTILEAVPPVCTAIGSWRRRLIPPSAQTPLTHPPVAAAGHNPIADKTSHIAETLKSYADQRADLKRKIPSTIARCVGGGGSPLWVRWSIP